ncbi:hypothetical protein GOL92_32030, partial [Sinorhizobium medicae]|nr:hypothetical protein [Sinorhizobium medicae]
RGRLFLGIGGRDHFGIRGRIASEFAVHEADLSRRWSPQYQGPKSNAFDCGQG